MVVLAHRDGKAILVTGGETTRMPTGVVHVIAIVVVILGAIMAIFSFSASFEPESGQWLFVASGLGNIALGCILLYVSTVAEKRKGV